MSGRIEVYGKENDIGNEGRKCIITSGVGPRVENQGGCDSTGGVNITCGLR